MLTAAPVPGAVPGAVAESALSRGTITRLLLALLSSGLAAPLLSTVALAALLALVVALASLLVPVAIHPRDGVFDPLGHAALVALAALLTLSVAAALSLVTAPATAVLLLSSLTLWLSLLRVLRPLPTLPGVLLTLL